MHLPSKRSSHPQPLFDSHHEASFQTTTPQALKLVNDILCSYLIKYLLKVKTTTQNEIIYYDSTECSVDVERDAYSCSGTVQYALRVSVHTTALALSAHDTSTEEEYRSGEE